MPSISGQLILIIDCSLGIAFALANLALAKKVRVVIASSGETKVNNAVERPKSAFPNGQVTGYVARRGGDDTESYLEKLMTDAT